MPDYQLVTFRSDGLLLCPMHHTLDQLMFTFPVTMTTTIGMCSTPQGILGQIASTDMHVFSLDQGSDSLITLTICGLYKTLTVNYIVKIVKFVFQVIPGSITINIV